MDKFYEQFKKTIGHGQVVQQLPCLPISRQTDKQTGTLVLHINRKVIHTDNDTYIKNIIYTQTMTHTQRTLYTQTMTDTE